MCVPKILLVAASLIALFVPPAQAADTIKVGAILAETGPASFFGAPQARTLRMLLEDINARGGINGKAVELILRDTESDPQKAIAYTRQLINGEGVFAIIGPSTSDETMAVKNIAEEGKTILISCAAGETIVNPVAKYVFKTPPMDRHAVIRVLEHLKKKGLSRIGVLSSKTEFGRTGKALIAKLAPEYGIQAALSESYDKAATDFTPQVARIKAADVQALVNWSLEPTQVVVLRSARKVGFTAPIFQSHGFGSMNYVKAAGADAEGVIFPGGRLLVADELSARNPQKTVLLACKKAYEDRFKEEVTTFGGHAYDAMKILEQAMKASGAVADREKVRTTIENMKGLVGNAGIYNFSPADHNGLDSNAFEMLTVKDGKFTVM